MFEQNLSEYLVDYGHLGCSVWKPPEKCSICKSNISYRYRQKNIRCTQTRVYASFENGGAIHAHVAEAAGEARPAEAHDEHVAQEVDHARAAAAS